jgi:glycosyltransferase involved in cell wall biosynthesis
MTTILYVNNTDPRDGGGGDRRIFEEAAALASREFDVRILASRTDPSLAQRRTIEGVSIRTVRCVPDRLRRFETVYFYLTRSLFPFVSLPVLLLTLWRTDVDVAVDSYTPHPSLLSIIAPLLACPVVAMVHEYHDRSALRKYPVPVAVIQLAVQTLLKSGVYQLVIVPGTHTRQALRDYGVEVPIEVVPNGIHYGTYAPSPDGGSPASTDLLVVSRLVHRKGIDRLLAALPAVVRERPATTLGIVGTGPQRRELEAAVEDLDLADHVTFHGYVPEKRKIDLLYGCSVFVLPSRQEGFGIAVLEAMATGTPVVATDLPVLRDLLPAEGGEFVDASDPDAFASAMLQSLSRWADTDAVERNQDRARRYAWDRIGRQAGEVYDGLA